MKFIESPIFTKLVYSYLSEQDYIAFQWSLAHTPQTGDIITGSGGLRKVRWGIKGKGKRGGIRIIYYYMLKNNQIWLLTLYAKNEADNIPLEILKKVKKELLK